MTSHAAAWSGVGDDGVGERVGARTGACVGGRVGARVGRRVGVGVGLRVGGACVGDPVVGACDGANVGAAVVGVAVVGAPVVGAAVVGAPVVGAAVVGEVGAVGASVGEFCAAADATSRAAASVRMVTPRWLPRMLIVIFVSPTVDSGTKQPDVESKTVPPDGGRELGWKKKSTCGPDSLQTLEVGQAPTRPEY